MLVTYNLRHEGELLAVVKGHSGMSNFDVRSQALRDAKLTPFIERPSDFHFLVRMANVEETVACPAIN